MHAKWSSCIAIHGTVVRTCLVHAISTLVAKGERQWFLWMTMLSIRSYWKLLRFALSNRSFERNRGVILHAADEIARRWWCTVVSSVRPEEKWEKSSGRRMTDSFDLNKSEHRSFNSRLVCTDAVGSFRSGRWHFRINSVCCVHSMCLHLCPRDQVSLVSLISIY